jgi:hypothetical protein
MRYRISAIGLDVGPGQGFRDADGNAYPANWTALVGSDDMAAIGMEAYEPKIAASLPSPLLTLVPKADIWRRATDAEAALIDAHLNALPVRLRRLWADSAYLDTNDETFAMLLDQLTTALGVVRAGVILQPTE